MSRYFTKQVIMSFECLGCCKGQKIHFEYQIIIKQKNAFFDLRWSPTYDVSAILTSIQSLLSDPNPNSPANSMAAQLFKENRREYEKRVKACVEQSWCDD